MYPKLSMRCIIKYSNSFFLHSSAVASTVLHLSTQAPQTTLFLHAIIPKLVIGTMQFENK